MITLKDLYFSVGEFPLLDNMNLTIPHGEKIALIGRNGEGKSTLFKIITGELSPDGGEVVVNAGVSIARLMQDMPQSSDVTVYEMVASGLKELSQLLVRYHELTQQEQGDDWLEQLTTCQEQIEHQNGWQIQQRVETILTALDLPADKKMSELSGGWRRRVALGQALVQEPDILLLDEPTNHLDIEAIQWLEHFLQSYSKTVIIITHDRALLRKVATQILELDRGKCTFYPPDYDEYCHRKAKALEDEQKQFAAFDKKLSQEEKWIRQGIKARRTRNEGRVRALKVLRDQRTQRRVQKQGPKFKANEVFQTGKDMITAEHISFAYGDKPLFKNFSFTISRGDKVAIVGPNGVGKTTLVKVLLGELPCQGKIKHSPTNQIAFFEQTRSALMLDETVARNVTEGDDFVQIGNKRQHVVGYLGDFLFSPDRCQQLAKTLSGGEQNRLLLAKLFSKPANILVLDEPTNDLDMESLEVLESLLLSYTGTVIIISHDREFIDNIATHTIGFGDNGVTVDVGGYSDWLNQQNALQKPKTKSEPTQPAKATTKPPSKKLSYHEQRELEQLPDKIAKLEEQISQFEAQMCSSDFYQDQGKAKEVGQALEQAKTQLEQAYERWEALE